MQYIIDSSTRSRCVCIPKNPNPSIREFWNSRSLEVVGIWKRGPGGGGDALRRVRLPARRGLVRPAPDPQEVHAVAVALLALRLADTDRTDPLVGDPRAQAALKICSIYRTKCLKMVASKQPKITKIRKKKQSQNTHRAQRSKN